MGLSRIDGLGLIGEKLRCSLRTAKSLLEMAHLDKLDLPNLTRLVNDFDGLARLNREFPKT